MPGRWTTLFRLRRQAILESKGLHGAVDRAAQSRSRERVALCAIEALGADMVATLARQIGARRRNAPPRRSPTRSVPARSWRCWQRCKSTGRTQARRCSTRCSSMDPQEVDARIAAMLADGKARLDTMLRAGAAGPLWAPEPSNAPQLAAYNSPADILLYGGAAGGGKSDLLLGLAVTAHRRAVIFRRAYGDLDGDGAAADADPAAAATATTATTWCCSHGPPDRVRRAGPAGLGIRLAGPAARLHRLRRRRAARRAKVRFVDGLAAQRRIRTSAAAW